MTEQPLLSIVTPTRGNFSDYWLEQLLNVRGKVEFVLVYFPGVPRKPIDDPRVKSITGPYKGEMMQRFVAFLNATGRYVLALDDDDYLHPEVLQLVTEYFQKFPESLVLRLRSRKIDQNKTEKIKEPWQPIPTLNQLKVARRTERGEEFTVLQEIPIAPLENAFDRRYFFWPFVERKDMHGPHIENFNNKVWDNEKVKQILPEISHATQISGILTWIPTSAFDRLMGLFVQAQFYQKDAIVGHWLPKPEQVRFIDKDPALKPPRFHVFSDVLLVKCFPQYGYFWNLFFNKLYGVPKAAAKAMKWKVLKARDRST